MEMQWIHPDGTPKKPFNSMTQAELAEANAEMAFMLALFDETLDHYDAQTDGDRYLIVIAAQGPSPDRQLWRDIGVMKLSAPEAYRRDLDDDGFDALLIPVRGYTDA